MNISNIVEAIKSRKFMPSKPIREVRAIDLKRDPEIIASRKHNGNSATLVIEAGNFDFYTTSNLHLATLDSKHWMEDPAWLQAMKDLPQNTVLRGEIYVPNTKIEDLGAFQEWYTYHMNKLEGSSTVAPQAATFKAFEVLSMGGANVASLPYKERFAMIPPALRVEVAPYTRLSQAQQAAEDARKLGIEGFVFWDANAKSLCKLEGSNFPRGGAWKAKPLFIETFQLRKLLNASPEKFLVQLGNDSMEFNCGSGLTMEERSTVVREFEEGKPVFVTIGHYGIDESGKPEIPTMQQFRTGFDPFTL